MKILSIEVDSVRHVSKIHGRLLTEIDLLRIGWKDASRPQERNVAFGDPKAETSIRIAAFRVA
jgi:hypothetical protein